ncbi:MAG: hypothetical protein A2033_11095 [Bacteroidetes bacterium GWA2_31_9]|nr:MAG: hypothetical protein A2033_11095 [Bacteroidetes bacterium GWA2_31_9]
MKPKIVIIGAGGHAKVICDAILAKSDFEIVGFVDSTIPVGTVIMNNFKVIIEQNELTNLKKHADFFIIGIGNNKIREELYNKLKSFLKPTSIIHPTAFIASNAIINSGTVCLANSIISANCTIGENTIINAGSIIDHESIIGNNVHISIGTLVGSNSIIGNNITTKIGQVYNSFSKAVKQTYY